jgi:hypothetical protein
METMTTMKSIVSGLILGLVASASFVSDAQAQPIIPVLVTDGPAEVNVLSSFSVDIDVQLPAGDYTGLQLKVLYPSAIQFIGSGSPTSAEFGDSVGVTGGRAWNQELSLDLSGGAGVRKFRITGNVKTNTVRDGGNVSFAVSLTGNVAETTGGLAVPFEAVPVAHVVISRGTMNYRWTNNGTTLANTTTIGGGPIVSGEATPRTGILRRFAFSTTNGGTARMDGPQNWTISGGSGYRFVRAFGHGWSPTAIANPDNAVASVVVNSTHTAWEPLVGPITATYTGTAQTTPALYVDVFVPCDDFGKTAEQNTELAANYQLTVNVASRFIDGAGAITPVELSHGPIGTLNLTSVCGQGGGVSKIEENLYSGGASTRWRIIATPPFGVTEVENAMLVDVLHPGVVQISSYNALGNILNSFTPWTCDFSTVFTGHFTPQQFLDNRDDHCRQGYGGVLPTDTHLVYFTPLWTSEDGVLLPASAYIQTRYDATWARANVGARITNRAYFNGTAGLFGALGDTVEEVDTEDPWEASALSDPLPADVNGLYFQVSRDPNGGNVNSQLIDANGQTRLVYAKVGNNGIYPLNPRLWFNIPTGVEVVSAAPSPSTSCSNYPSSANRVFPSDLTTSPLFLSFGDATVPWRLATEGCRPGIDLTFRLDPSFPFIDGQIITFSGAATADTQVGAQITDSTTFRAVVTTGMDVRLEGGCWTAPELEVTPPKLGLILYKASAINRGTEDLDAMELRFIMPPGSVYQTAFAGVDFPSGATLQVSRDGGTTWANAPTLPDPTVTDVRVAGFSIDGLGLAAARPSFYVAVEANAPTGMVVGGAWVQTPTSNLGRTPTKLVEVDAAVCEPVCDCAPSSNACVTVGCDDQGACVTTPVENGTACTFDNNLCVLAASCVSGSCRAIEEVKCEDQDMCTADACNPQTGLCTFAAPDCSTRPVYMPVTRLGRPAGAIMCTLVPMGDGMTLQCDTKDGAFVLHADQAGVCN